MLAEDSPENWAQHEAALLSSPLSPSGTLIDLFAAQIAALDPALADRAEAMRSGGVNTRDGKVEEPAE